MPCLFATHGYEATGIRDAARDAGLSLSTTYHYVDGKEQLLLAIATSWVEGFRAAAEEALVDKARPPERLGALVESHVMVDGVCSGVLTGSPPAGAGSKRCQVVRTRR